MTESLPEHDNTPGAGSADDDTLGGYLSVHDRPPAFEGSDGHPYTVSIEIEGTGNLLAPYLGYLVFPRWAQTGVGIVGHVESEILAHAPTAEEARSRVGRKSLLEVRAILEDSLARSTHLSTPGSPLHAP